MLRLSALALAAALSLVGRPTLAEGPGVMGVYGGNLGREGIVLEIRPIEDTNYDGRYFYRRHGVGIPLAIARLPDGSLRVQEMRGDAPTGAEWRLVVTGEKATGEFCKCDASGPASPAQPRLPIVLRLLSAGKEGQRDAYQHEILDFPLADGPEIRVNDRIAYVMARDPRFDATLPRLTRFPDATVMAKVNTDLARARDDLRLDAAECRFGAQIPNDAEAYWQEAYKVAVIDRDLLSIGGWVGRQCGDSAYPNDTVGTLIYNLRSGDRFDFAQDSAQFFLTPAPAYDALLALYQKHRGNLKGDCRDAPAGDLDIKGRIYFAANGLVIDPHDSLPHAYAGCATAVTIPYREIRDLVQSDSPFYPRVAR